MRRVESYPHFTNEAAEAPRAEMTCPSDCYGMGQEFLTQLCLMPKPGPVQNPAGSRARGGQSSVLGGGADPVSFPRAIQPTVPPHRVGHQDVPGFSTASPASWETPLSWADQDSWSLTLQVAQPRPPGTTRSSDREERTRKSSAPAHLSSHPPPPRPGRAVERKANSNLCVAASAPPWHQGNATCCGQPATAEQREGGAVARDADGGSRPGNWPNGESSSPRQRPRVTQACL